MTNPSDALAEQAAAFAARVADLGFGGGDDALDRMLESASDAALRELTERLGPLGRLFQAVAARLGGEIATRSARGVDNPLSQRLGEKTAPAAMAALAGVPLARAAEWCRTGEALAPRRALTGEPLPPLHPAVAAALDAGELDLADARTTLDTLEAVAPATDAQTLAALEEKLVEQALELPSATYARFCRGVIDQFDPDGVEPREEELRAKSGITIVQRRNGLTRYIVDAHPEAAGRINTALDARTAPSREVRFAEEGEEPVDAALEDTRTLPQKRLDALLSLCTDALKRDDGDLSGTAVTVLVTVTREALTTGIGAAQIYGVDEPISAATARRMAADAQIIPVVLGGKSQPLDLGEARRLFTTAQRLAMAVRDGGCIWPGCHEPPGRCQAAHLDPWSRTRNTDLENGVLLCPFHHRRFDLDGWDIRFDDGVPYLIPPPWLDPARTPRRAGRPAALTL